MNKEVKEYRELLEKIKLLEKEVVDLKIGWYLDEFENLRFWPEEIKDAKVQIDRLQLQQYTWLWTHCRSLGMSKKSCSGTMEHDIALFITDLHNNLEGKH